MPKPLAEFMAQDEDDPASYNRVFRRTHSPFIVDGRPADLQPLRWLEPNSWQGQPIPERKWLVPDLIPEGNVTMLAGDGGIGKSLLALQLLVACALGKPWVGLPCRPCRALGFFCEDSEDELRIRLRAVLDHYGADMQDLVDLKLISRIGEENLLVQYPDPWNAGEQTALFTRLCGDAEDFGAELIVIDSLHDVFGGNENSRVQARHFIGTLRSLAMQQHGAVLQTAHPSKDGRATGSGEAGNTAWHNAVRSRLYLTGPKANGDEEPDLDARVLANKKANYSRRGAERFLIWKNHVFLSNEPDQGILGTIERQTINHLVLGLIQSFAAKGRYVSENPRAGNYAPRVFLGLPETKGRTLGELRRAMEALFSSGKITVGDYKGTGRHSHQCIRVTEVLI